ncbi:TetR/AcrR family transcriptional regulator [Microbacterium sp. NIBRBAC000506063]|uniref:TetR/AcrR family transcriptional regulator n=1 Tax=Microbacterium sp. NIBRBAC000506063 TaxID=2734618 RepID=UPI001BB600A0|nr:TetR/AcrR family transcriptional regulator [Microbacterium sp. NIBRBAC000506063]QTV80101.1 TetR/AcrR family transcriptional regulator [Microbacterium sp. NIBRBAC000506063]
MTTSVTRSRENTRARLRDAAAQLFAEVGIEGASVEAICERAGFTRGAFYSNFESKDELFLDLAATVAESRLASARARVDELVASGALACTHDIVPLVEQVMLSAEKDRFTVLLMSEIQLHALRDADFAEAYVAQEREMFASIEAMIGGIVDSGALALRVDVPTAAKMLMTAWEGAMVRTAMEGGDDDQIARAASAALGTLVELLIAPA